MSFVVYALYKQEPLAYPIVYFDAKIATKVSPATFHDAADIVRIHTWIVPGTWQGE